MLFTPKHNCPENFHIIEYRGLGNCDIDFFSLSPSLLHFEPEIYEIRKSSKFCGKITNSAKVEARSYKIEWNGTKFKIHYHLIIADILAFLIQWFKKFKMAPLKLPIDIFCCRSAHFEQNLSLYMNITVTYWVLHHMADVS